MPPPDDLARRRAIGKRIRDRRVERGLTQKALAEALGVHPGTLSGWELGTRVLPAERLLDIASLLQSSVADLLGEQ